MKDAKEVVPKSSGKSGNTKLTSKQIPPAKKWCFTLNNYSENDIAEIKFCKEFQSSNKYMFQEEKGELGTEHLQGFIHFSRKLRPLSLNLCGKRIHWEKMKGSIKENIIYCSKPEDRIGKCYYKGCKPFKPIITITEKKFYPWQKSVLDIIRNESSDRKIHWVWETAGNVGKSAFCKWLCIHECAILCSGRAKDMKYLITQMDAEGSPTDLIVFDIPRSRQNKLSYVGMEEIKNGCFCSSKYETKMTIINSPCIVVFSNFQPQIERLSLDRWSVYKIIENQLVNQSAPILPPKMPDPFDGSFTQGF